MKRSRAALGLTLFAAVACGPVDAPPSEAAPQNDSCPNNCADYSVAAPSPPATCVRYGGSGLCAVNDGSFQFVLLVSVPEEAPTAPGDTYALSIPDASTGSSGVLVLDDPVEASGAYVTQPSVASQVGRLLYNSPLYTTLPVHGTFRPVWRTSSSGDFFDALAHGLPLLPITSGVVRAIVWPDNTPPLDANSRGPGGASTIGWDAQLPPMPAAGGYQRDVEVDPPFNDAFPPDPGDPKDPTAALGFDDELLRVAKPRPVTVAYAGPGGLDGWQIFTRESASGRRVSNLVTLHGLATAATANLFTKNPEPDSGWEVDIVPADASMPVWVNPLVLQSPFPTLTYPSFIAPRHVAGTLSASGIPASGSITFVGQILVLPDGTQSSYFHYETTVSTGVTGEYSVTLPEGSYWAVITPADASNAAMVLDFDTTKSRDLSIGPRTQVAGGATLADGRTLADADVEFTPSLNVTKRTNLAARPAHAHAHTHTDGSFEASLDPGTYDITVRPSDGSHLPWLISAAHVIGSQAVALDNIAIPPPILESITLHDSLKNPIANAVVQAYYFDAESFAHQVGVGLTDPLGHVDLFLTRPR